MPFRIYYLLLISILFFVLSCSDDPTSSDDTQNPVVLIVTPVNNSDFQENTVITIEVNATDNESVTEVLFYIDDSLEFTDNAAPYSYDWNTNGKVGNHTIEAKANDASNNTGSSAILSISIIELNLVDIDGNIYQIVKIGNQWWMAENLKVTHYRNGDAIPNVTAVSTWSTLSTGAYCNYNNDTTNVATYGRLYNWFAVDDSRNIAPAGWHVPTDDEWKELEMHLGMTQAQADLMNQARGTDEGGKLKEAGTVHWSTPNTGATNSSGFTALPAGNVDGDVGNFNNLNNWCDFWTSSHLATIYGIYRNMENDISMITRGRCLRSYGFSVRCVRD